jgi:hypothetical protein
MTPILARFEPRHAALWGRHNLMLEHRLHEDPQFTDDGLVALLEELGRPSMNINTMAAEGHDLESWQACDPGTMTAAELLAAVKAGRLWINVIGINESSPRFARILDQLYGELEAAMPGFKTFKRKLGLLISSPKAQVFYHCDIPGQGLLQVRGKKRLWVYPAAEPFLAPRHLEEVVRGVRQEEIPYEPWFDEHAVVYDLEPGQMLHWPLNGPHRVVNHDCLNVSLTVEHWTDEILRSYLMNMANGVLRGQLGWQPRSRATSGPTYWGKAGLAAFWRFSGLQNRQRYRPAKKVRIDELVPAQGG